MRGRAVPVVLLLGCNQILGLEEPKRHEIDAPPDPCTLLPSDQDEDCDGVPNDTDKCPGIADDQRDDDGDGVGNACDPHPATPGDALVSAEFFNGPTNMWAPSAGADWKLENGAYVTTSVADMTNAIAMLTASLPEPTIELGFDIETYSPPAEQLDARFAVKLSGAGKTAECRFVSHGLGQPLDHLEVFLDTQIQANTIFPTPVAAQQRSTLRLTFDRNGEACTINGVIVTGSPALTGAAAGGTIEATYLQLGLQYVLVYKFTGS